jgi:hypothetical protein
VTISLGAQFLVPRPLVHIAVLPNADLEAVAVRSVLEALGCEVVIHWIGTPGDFLKVLAQGQSAPSYLLISGHGADGLGFYLGEYGAHIDTSMLSDEHLPPEAIAPVIDLPGCTVISSACATGTEAMANAFINTARLKTYIACSDYPNGSAMLVWLTHFFFSVITKKLTVRDAFERARMVTEHPSTEQMRLFQPADRDTREGQESHASL